MLIERGGNFLRRFPELSPCRLHQSLAQGQRNVVGPRPLRVILGLQQVGIAPVKLRRPPVVPRRIGPADLAFRDRAELCLDLCLFSINVLADARQLLRQFLEDLTGKARSPWSSASSAAFFLSGSMRFARRSICALASASSITSA